MPTVPRCMALASPLQSCAEQACTLMTALIASTVMINKLVQAPMLPCHGKIGPLQSCAHRGWALITREVRSVTHKQEASPGASASLSWQRLTLAELCKPCLYTDDDRNCFVNEQWTSELTCSLEGVAVLLCIPLSHRIHVPRQHSRGSRLTPPHPHHARPPSALLQTCNIDHMLRFAGLYKSTSKVRMLSEAMSGRLLPSFRPEASCIQCVT